MKAIILLFLIYLFMWNDSATQTVFAPQGAMWHYYLDGDGTGANYKFEVEKDTIYEGILSSKVIRSGTKNATYFYTSWDTVFYYHDSLKSFTPLYIFNVKVGDSISIVAPPPFYGRFADTARFIIKKIDTIIVDGLPLRTVYTNQLDYFYFLPKYTERIGGYVGNSVLCIDGTRTADHSLGLRCYSDKEIEEKFVNDKWDCDYVPNNIDEKTITTDIRIFPNPANQQLFVEIDEHNAKGQIQLLSLVGKLVIQKEIIGASNKIDVSTIDNNLYLLNVKTDKECISRLISIMH